MARKKFLLDKKEGVWKAKFYELLEFGKTQPQRITLCTIVEAELKETSRGLVRRSERERNNFLDHLRSEKLKELLAKKKIDSQTSLTPPIKDIMQNWIEHLESLGRAKSTIEAYLVTINYYIDVLGNHPIAEFSTENVNSLLRHLKVIVQPNTIKKHSRQLRAFAEYAIKHFPEYLKKRIVFDKVTAIKRKAVIYSQANLDSLENLIRKGIDETNHLRRKMFKINHLRAYFMFRYLILRRGEVFHLPLRHINLDDGCVSLMEVQEIGWKQKNSNEDILPISQKLNLFLSEDLSSRTPKEVWYLDDGFGNICYSDMRDLTKAFKRYCNMLGFKRVKPIHSIRAGGITELIEKSGDPAKVQQLARHSSILTTMGYVDPKALTLQNLVEDL